MAQRVEAPSYNKRDAEDDRDESAVVSDGNDDNEVISDEEGCVPEDIEGEDQYSQSQDPDALFQKRYAKRSPLNPPSVSLNTVRMQKNSGKTKDTQTIKTIKTSNPPPKPNPDKYATKPKTGSK